VVHVDGLLYVHRRPKSRTHCVGYANSLALAQGKARMGANPVEAVEHDRRCKCSTLYEVDPGQQRLSPFEKDIKLKSTQSGYLGTPKKDWSR
jgi:hypothetical protein